MTDFKAKMHQILFRLGRSAPDPAGRAYSAPPDPLAAFGGPASKGRGGRGKGGERRGGERAISPQYLKEVYAYGKN